MRQGLLAECMNLMSGFVPINMATGANAGDWVAMKNFSSLAIVIFKAAGDAGEPAIVTVSQATDNTGTGTKALNFTRIDLKAGAALTSIGNFTKVVQAAANTYSIEGDYQAIAVIEIDATALDVANEFDYIQASIADVGATSQIGGILYMGENVYKAPVTSPLL